MADLVVDYNLLDQVESTLSGLRSEFSDIQAQQHAYVSAWGSGAIASAMDDFAGNWDYHRKELLDSMESLGEMVGQCKSSFAKADTDLANSLTRKK
jgi:uncharacterized protein YukE